MLDPETIPEVHRCTDVLKPTAIEHLHYKDLSGYIEEIYSQPEIAANATKRISRRGMHIRIISNPTIDHDSPLGEMIIANITARGGIDVEFGDHHITWLMPRSNA